MLQQIDSKHLAALEAELARVTAQRDALREALRPLQAWAENERRMHSAHNEDNEAAYMGELSDSARTALLACQD